jgi:GntR family transcriptional regulator
LTTLQQSSTLVLVLNPESPMPLYQQLAADLTQRISAGEYPCGERLPSEPQLAALHHIGRPTVRQATDLLVHKGLIERRRGSGTYVRKVEPEVDLFDLGGTIAAFKKSGLALCTVLLQRPALRHVEDASNPMSGQKAYSLARLGRLDDLPVLIEHTFLSAEVFPGFDQIIHQGQSLSQLVERYYHRVPCGSRQVFTIGTLPRHWVPSLGVTAKTPLLVVRRTLEFSGAGQACCSTMFCRTDRVQFVQTLPVRRL